jgi:hypothetical protein
VHREVAKTQLIEPSGEDYGDVDNGHVAAHYDLEGGLLASDLAHYTGGRAAAPTDGSLFVLGAHKTSAWSPLVNATLDFRFSQPYLSGRLSASSTPACGNVPLSIVSKSNSAISKT